MLSVTTLRTTSTTLFGKSPVTSRALVHSPLRITCLGARTIVHFPHYSPTLTELKKEKQQLLAQVKDHWSMSLVFSVGALATGALGANTINAGLVLAHDHFVGTGVAFIGLGGGITGFAGYCGLFTLFFIPAALSHTKQAYQTASKIRELKRFFSNVDHESCRDAVAETRKEFLKSFRTFLWQDVSHNNRYECPVNKQILQEQAKDLYNVIENQRPGWEWDCRDIADIQYEIDVSMITSKIPQADTSSTDQKYDLVNTSKTSNADASNSCSIDQNYHLIKFISVYMKEYARDYTISWHNHPKDATKVVMHIHKIWRYTPVSPLDRYS